MQALARCWRDFLTVRSTNQETARQEYLTRIGMVLATFIVGALLSVVAVGWWLSVFDAEDLVILLGASAIILVFDLVTFRGHWRWASYALPTVFWATACYLAYRSMLWGPAAVFYAPAIALAGALLGTRAQWIALGLSMISYAAFGWFGHGDASVSEYVATWVAAVAPLATLASVQWFAQRLLTRAYHSERKALERLQRANADLQTEVTERRRTERALAESEARYRAIFESVPVGMMSAELRTNDQLILTGANPAIANMLGIELAPLIGEITEKGFPALTGTNLFERARRTATTGEGWHIPRVADPTSSGTRLYEVSVFPSGPGRIVGVIMDITERERAFDELRLLQAAVEQIDEAVVVTSAEGIARYFNPAFERITGFAKSDLGALGLDGAVIPLETLAPIRETLDAGQSWSGRITAWGKDNAFSFPAALTASPIRDAKGRTTHYAFVGRDISEQIALEEQLRQAQKMEAVGQLAGGVAHDFNNLLQVIQGYTELAHQDIVNPDSASADLDEVMTAAQRATSLVRQLLAFSRRDMIKPAYLDLNEVTAGLMKMLRRLIGEHIALETDFYGESAPIYADAGQIEQVIINLCVNARDAIPVADGGRIVIRTGRATLTPAFAAEHLWARAGEFVTLSVQDTGVGIAPEVMEHLFEPFFTTKGPGKGTGLGLAMVYGVVKQHGGLIEVQSAMGQGATFTLYLPEAEPPPSIAQGDTGAANGASSAPQGRGECILVAEDEPLVRRLVENLLTRAGYRVFAASDGAEAAQLYAEHAAEVRLALLDVVMPGMSGRAVAEQLRAQSPALPILFSSGYDFQLLEQALPSGERANLVHKPYNPAELLRRVREALEE